jgi:hypothetical protein
MTEVLMNHRLLDHPVTEAPAWARVTAAAADLWRVADGRGRVLGHVRTVRTSDGWRYRAERFDVAAHRFRRVGEFWRPGEALECLRYLT